MDRFSTRAGSFALERTPGRPSALRGWTAADELLVATLEADHDLAAIRAAQRPVVVANPGSGAVPIALAAHGLRVALLSDSYLDVSATVANAAANGVDTALLSVVQPDEVETLGAVPLAVVLVPKRLALLDAQLRALRPVLDVHTTVLGAGMTRHIHTSTIASFEACVGPTVTSRATRKARLILPRVDPSLAVDPPPAPVTVRSHGLTLVNDATGFSPKRVDAGTELLLAHLVGLETHVDLEAYRGDDGVVRLADVGCGNGIIGAAVLAQVPNVAATFVDESYAAVRSARATVDASLGALDIEPRFVVGDALRSFGPAEDGTAVEVPAPGTLDVVVSNPPFHHDHAVTDEIAWGIFTSAHRALRRGGLLLIVGNRHLGYHAKLKRLFGNATVVASNSKFVVLSATRR